MTSASRVPRLQSLHDLLYMEAVTDERALGRVQRWEARTGCRLPAALRELYTTTARIPPGPVELSPGEPPWTLSLERLYAEYWERPLEPLSAVLEGFELALAGEPPPTLAGLDADPPPAQWGPLVYVESEVMVIWRLFVELDGSDDPPMCAHCRDSTDRRAGWTREPHRFADWLFQMFASAYVEWDTPYSYFGPEADRAWDDGTREYADDEMHELLKPYENGLWLRAREEPFVPPFVDLLLERYPEGPRRSLPGGVTSYAFDPAGGRIIVTADDPELEGGLSTWWIYGDTPEVLLELGRLVAGLGSLARRLRADTARAAEVLQALGSSG